MLERQPGNTSSNAESPFDAAQIGVQAVYEWARSRDIPEEDIFVQEAMSRFLEGAEGSLDTATLETLAKQHLSTIWTWHAMKMTRYFGIDWDRGSRGVGIGSACRMSRQSSISARWTDSISRNTSGRRDHIQSNNEFPT